MRKNGFTLIECLLGLALSLFVISTGSNSSSGPRRPSSGSRRGRRRARRRSRRSTGCGSTSSTPAAASPPKSGSGSSKRRRRPPRSSGRRTLEKALTLAADSHAGDTRLPLASTADITAGQQLALREGAAGEVRTVVRVDAGAVIIDAPLERGYSQGNSSLCLIERVTYFLDGTARILRRRVNASPAQPLLEGAAGAEWSLDAAAHLVRIRLELDTEGAHPHEATVFLKNPALAEKFGT